MMNFFGWFKIKGANDCIWTGQRNLTLHRSRWVVSKSELEFAVRLGIYAYGWGMGSELTITELTETTSVRDPVMYLVQSEYCCERDFIKKTRTMEVWDFQVIAKNSSLRSIMEAVIKGLQEVKKTKYTLGDSKE